MVGIEVKARLEDWPTGLAQARAYRAGVHQAYLAAPAGRHEDRRLLESASEAGIGLLFRLPSGWSETIRPADPRPHPQHLRTTSLALSGVPAARRLQLNHPLNYLVVPFLIARHPGRSAVELLAEHWLDLGSDGTRRHAVEGARMLGLVTREDALTPLGATAADLLAAVGFDLTSRTPKRSRLVDAAPGMAAVARAILQQHPAVRLIVETLDRVADRSAPVAELVTQARRHDEVLARALLLSDPGLRLDSALGGPDFNPSTVYKLKQVLWHAGLLATKAEGSAGGAASAYAPHQDQWTLDARVRATVDSSGS